MDAVNVRSNIGLDAAETYGRLKEGGHLAGYTLERACTHLEWLLEEDRWCSVGAFADINAFLATLSDFGQFRIIAEQRKRIAQRIKELQPEAQNTKIAGLLGVGESTVRRDTSPNGEADRENVSNNNGHKNEGSPDGEPSEMSGADAAKLAARRAARIQRDQEAERNRIEAARRNAQTAPGTVDIRHGDFRRALADLTDVDAIITDPPYGKKFLPLLADLAAWSHRVLSKDGILAVLMGHSYLPEVYRLLSGGRPYRWTACLLVPGPNFVSHSARVQSGWKPILIYGGGPRFADVIRSEGADIAAKSHHAWGQDYAAFETLVSRITAPNQTVVDPFCGSGTTLLAAHVLGRDAIGCDIDEEHVKTARERCGQ